jgi:Mg2+/Co2+ transporter CorB
VIWAIVAALAPTLVVLIVISAVISGAETAMIASSRGRMHQLERDGDHAARLLSWPTYWVVRLLGPIANGAQWIVR